MVIAAASFALAIPALSDELVLPSLSAVPGTRVVLPVTYTSQGSVVAGLQFDVLYDSSALSLAAVQGELVRRSGKVLHSASLGPNKQRFLIAGGNLNQIASGILLQFLVYLSPSAADGQYSLTFSNVVAASPDAQPESVTATSGTILIQNTSGQVTRLQPAGIVNGASFLSGPVAPGEIITLRGAAIGPASASLPDVPPASFTLAGTQVLFDGLPAPLLYAAPNQIDLIVPVGISGNGPTQIQIVKDGNPVSALSLPTTPSAPGIFTVDSSGIGAGTILNEDASLNSPSTPAARGSAVGLFITGAGATVPPSSDGVVAQNPLPQLMLPVSVSIGGMDAEILYSGAAPALVTGVDLLVCRIPAGAASGSTVPVIVKIGMTSSQPGVTLAVQ